MPKASRRYIADCIIDSFCSRFNRPPTELSSNTDLKQHFNYNSAGWAGMADALSAERWMKKIRVRLAAPDMVGATTVKALTEVIWRKQP